MTVALLASWLMAAGCGHACASGVIANMHAESGLDPCAVSRSGVGLVQYSGHRRKRLMATLGDRWCDPRAQFDHIVQEMRELGLFDRLSAAGSPEQAAALFRDLFERPLRKSRDRERRARVIYDGLASAR